MKISAKNFGLAVGP